MYPDEIITQFRQKYVNGQIKSTFISAILVGLLSHGYMLANKLPNYDDIACMINNYGTGIESGRWMLSVLGTIVRKTIGNYSIPWFNGIISICIIAIAACVVTQTFEIKDKVLCVLVGGIMISIPAITGILFFMYTSVYYCLSILACAVAVFCGKRYKYGLFAGMVFLSVSLGIYQAYLSFGASLFLLLLIQKCLQEDAEWKDILGTACKYLLLLVGALLIYLICVRLFLWIKGTQLLSYQGLDKMGKINIRDIPQMIGDAYKNYIKLFYSEMYGFNTYFVIRGGILLLHILSVFIIMWSIRKKGLLVIMEIILFTLLFPLATNLIYIMAPNTYVYSIMVYSLVTIYLASIVLMQFARLYLCENNRGWCFLHWCGTLIVALIIFVQCQYNNVQYLAMTMQYEQAYSYMTTLVTRIKSVQGYDDSLKVAFIGGGIEDSTFYCNDEFEDYNMGGRSQTLINLYSQKDFLKRYLGYNQTVVEEQGGMDDLLEVRQMPSYPDDGSIKIIDNTVVVKLRNKE